MPGGPNIVVPLMIASKTQEAQIEKSLGNHKKKEWKGFLKCMRENPDLMMDVLDRSPAHFSLEFNVQPSTVQPSAISFNNNL